MQAVDQPKATRPGLMAQAGWTDLPDALHAEWTKLRTLASTWWLLAAAVALTVVVGAAVAAAVQCSPSGCAPAQTGPDPAKISLALIALLALGVTTAVRDSAAGIGLVLGLLYLFPIVSSVIPDHVLSRHLEQIAPMTAGLYIQATTGLQSLPLTPWEGLGVVAAWAAGALLLGGLLLRLRDA